MKNGKLDDMDRHILKAIAAGRTSLRTIAEFAVLSPAAVWNRVERLWMDDYVRRGGVKYHKSTEFDERKPLHLTPRGRRVVRRMGR